MPGMRRLAAGLVRVLGPLVRFSNAIPRPVWYAMDVVALCVFTIGVSSGYGATWGMVGFVGYAALLVVLNVIADRHRQRQARTSDASGPGGESA